MNDTQLPPLPLPPGVRSRHVALPTGLHMHLLESGQPVDNASGKPLIVLLHGFPELAFNWWHLPMRGFMWWLLINAAMDAQPAEMIATRATGVAVR